MYEPHVCFDQPEDLAAPLWRFLDLPKFLSLLQTRSLFFTRGDLFRDPYEGMPSDEVAAAFPQDLPIGVMDWARSFTPIRRAVFVNCWHLSPHESAAMWSVYSASSGLALRTTYRKLRDALGAWPHRAYMGTVRYGEDQASNAKMNALGMFMNKRRSFEHEREVRIVLMDLSGTLPGRDKDRFPPGVLLPVNLGNVVEEVVVSPDAPDWLTGVIASVSAEYGNAFPVRRSSLYRLTYGET
jgi:hypothetical protein